MHRDTDQRSLRAIKENNMIFISAQPDIPYFHWQVELYLYQFSKHNIIDQCYALFGYVGLEPSRYVKKLANKHKGIKYYKDERLNKTYSPGIRPHLLSKFFNEYPHLGKNVFYHDSDIFLTKLPDFSAMLGPKNNISYLSDTISYIGYEYIKMCSERYRNRYRYLKELDLFYKMCQVLDIDPELVKSNQRSSGGAQYLLKGIDSTFWRECEDKCVKLYDLLCTYEKQYKIDHHIQKWTTDMWVVLWNYWKIGGVTAIHPELSFSWATGTVNDYNKFNIFHLAGVTKANCKNKFNKGLVTKQSVFEAYLNDPTMFDHIDKTNATYEYVNVIKEYTNNVYIKERNDVNDIVENKKGFGAMKGFAVINTKSICGNNIKMFKLISDKPYSMQYLLDPNVYCCNKNIWRSENRQYIIFWTGMTWILTFAKYEKHMGERCGGIASCNSAEPYDNHWNEGIIIRNE